MRFRAALLVVIAAGLTCIPSVSAQAQSCGRAVIFTTPGITWTDVAELRPPNLLKTAAEGSIGSLAVRTNSSRTTYASGYATIGAGARVDVPQSAAQPEVQVVDGREENVAIPDVDRIRELLVAQGYSTVRPGALATALFEGFNDPAKNTPILGPGVVAVGNSDPGLPPATPEGFGRYALLASMNEEGWFYGTQRVGSHLLEPDPNAPFGVRSNPQILQHEVFEAMFDASLNCGVIVIDPGDLIRADRAAAIAGQRDAGAWREAVLAADDLLGFVRERLTPADLLLVVSPTSPAVDEDVHFGIAIATGPTFEEGGVLESASTRRTGLVTLPDIAPTVLGFYDVERPSRMLGRSLFTATTTTDDRIAAAVALDDESVFIDRVRTPVSTVFVLVQVLLYALTVWVLARRERRTPVGRPARRWLEICGLALAAFPLATFVAGFVPGDRLGAALYSILLIGVDAALVGTAVAIFRDPLERLFAIAASTLGVLLVDLVVGAPLQLNTVFSYSPIVAGRFAGIGNLAFAILAAASVLTGALMVHRFGRSRRVLGLVALLFAVTVVVDGAPPFGSDVGGAIALVPGLGISWLLLSGRRPNLRLVALAGLSALIVLGALLAFDLSRPEDQQTHLARLFQDVRDQGFQVFADTITRKVRTNLRVARSTIWTFVVPPALALMAWLLLLPRGRWERLSREHPPIAAGLIGGAVLAVLGFAVNDSGIVIPAMMISYMVPVALLAQLSASVAHEDAET
ncbi:MAG: hypothetical protein QOG54_670 [Actinomycetota bacterium]|nr:hypothetical protein [Actinomycetota bacterium]